MDYIANHANMTKRDFPNISILVTKTKRLSFYFFNSILLPRFLPPLAFTPVFSYNGDGVYL